MRTVTGDNGARGLRRADLVKAAGLVLALAGLLWQCVHTTELVAPSAGDFEAYWMAVRLLLSGGNPYSLEEVAALQGATPVRDGTVKVAWNPPWTLALLLPFGFPGFALSRALWLLFIAGMMFGSAGILWQCYGGSMSHRWVAALLCVLFPPALQALWNGQIVPLLLGGIAGFLYGEARGRWWCAGLLLALGAVKPHLLCLFWVVLFLWVLHHRRWSVIAGLALAVAAATGVAFCVDSSILTRYWEMMANEPALPPLFMTATTGALLRTGARQGESWLQLAPLVVGTCWATVYYWRHRHSWQWGERVPVLLLASVIVAPYAWPPDFVILLPAILDAATRVWRAGVWTACLALAIYVPLVVAAFAMWFPGVTGVWYAWQPWAVLGAYAVARRLADPKHPAEEPSPGLSLEHPK